VKRRAAAHWPARVGAKRPPLRGFARGGSDAPRRAAAHRSARAGAKRRRLHGFAWGGADATSRRSALVRKGRSERRAPGPKGSGACSGRPATAADTTEGFAPSTWRADRQRRSGFAPAALADRPGVTKLALRARQAQPGFAPAAFTAEPARTAELTLRGTRRSGVQAPRRKCPRRKSRGAKQADRRVQRGSNLEAPGAAGVKPRGVARRTDDPQRRSNRCQGAVQALHRVCGAGPDTRLREQQAIGSESGR
jgi:hypothetical protein